MKIFRIASITVEAATISASARDQIYRAYQSSRSNWIAAMACAIVSGVIAAKSILPTNRDWAVGIWLKYAVIPAMVPTEIYPAVWSACASRVEVYSTTRFPFRELVAFGTSIKDFVKLTAGIGAESSVILIMMFGLCVAIGPPPEVTTVVKGATSAI